MGGEGEGEGCAHGSVTAKQNMYTRSARISYKQPKGLIADARLTLVLLNGHAEQLFPASDFVQ